MLGQQFHTQKYYFNFEKSHLALFINSTGITFFLRILTLYFVAKSTSLSHCDSIIPIAIIFTSLYTHLLSELYFGFPYAGLFSFITLFPSSFSQALNFPHVCLSLLLSPLASDCFSLLVTLT